MAKNAQLSVRVKPEVKARLEEIARCTRYQPGDILEKFIMNTQVDPVTKEFSVDCSSGT